MPFKYDKLFVLLKEKGITTYRIRRDNLISQAALTKMKNGDGNIDTRTLERLCALLHCQPGDIMEYVEMIRQNKRERAKARSFIFLTSFRASRVHVHVTCTHQAD